jgi:hypothetical protein
MVFFLLPLIAAGVAGYLIADGGKTTAKNEVKSMTDISMSILNEFAVDCSTTLSQDNIINASDDCSITLEDTDLTNTAYVDKSCLLSVSNVAQMQATIAQQMDQMAETVSQQFSLAKAESENLIDSTIILSQDIVNTFTLDCSEDLYQSNQVTCSGNGNITLKGVTLENFAKIQADCVQDVLNSSEAAVDVETIIGQSAKAKQEGKFAALIPAVLAVIALIVIVMIVIKSGNSSKGKGSKWPIGIIIGVFIFIGVIVILYTKKAAKKTKYPSPKVSGSEE